MTRTPDPVVSRVVSPVVSPVVRSAADQAKSGLEPAGQRASTRPNPVVDQSRLRKGVNPLPFRPRSAADEQRLALARLLTDRDRQVLRAVGRFRVLTSDQLTEIFFDSRRRAQARLLHLHRLQILDRFDPFRPAFGRAPLHYVTGRLGAAVLAAENMADPDRAMRRWKADRALVLGGSQKLLHLLAINGFYADLTGYARHHPDADLLDWMTEEESSRWSDEIVRPDAYGVWQHAEKSVEFFLEYDRGTEVLARLAGKLAGYERFEAESGSAAWVLFAFPSARRETTARRALAGATCAVATAAAPVTSQPHDAIWSPLGNRDDRVRLAELADVPKPIEALRRAAAGSDRAWRFARSRPADEEAPIETP